MNKKQRKKLDDIYIITAFNNVTSECYSLRKIKSIMNKLEANEHDLASDYFEVWNPYEYWSCTQILEQVISLILDYKEVESLVIENIRELIK